MQRLVMKFAFPALVILLLATCATSYAQETAGEDTPATVFPLDDEGRLVQFERDVAPILRSQCLECHGPDDAKNDFRVDDIEMMLDYVEPEDAESSTMYVDYLTIDDEDMLMPPATHGGPLSAGELALIRVWIQEGAHVPEDFSFAEASEVAAAPAAPPRPKTLSQRIWAAQGFLHPATVHFPIAFFLLGAVFVVLGWKWPSVGMQIPLACLLLGALSSIAASAMGWSLAPEQGYGSGWNVLDWAREVDAHRWSAVIVTIFSSVLALIALIALWKDSEKLTRIWKIGLLLCAGMVGAVGHQGGEMSYGTDFYPRAWRILTGAPRDGEEQAAEQVAQPVDAAAESNAPSVEGDRSV